MPRTCSSKPTGSPITRKTPTSEKKQLEELLSKSGVMPNTTIVAYGDNNNWFAAWFFWLLKYHGHKDVKLVNGGRAKWIAEQRALSNDAPSYSRRECRAGTPDASIRVLRDYVLDKVVSGSEKIVDVRSPKEFAGELLAPENLPREGAQRAGHIPGAQNIPWATAVAEDGRPEIPPRTRANTQLRRILDGVGLPHRRAHREVRHELAAGPTAGRSETLSTRRYPQPPWAGDPSAVRGPSVLPALVTTPPPRSGALFGRWIFGPTGT